MVGARVARFDALACCGSSTTPLPFNQLAMKRTPTLTWQFEETYHSWHLYVASQAKGSHTSWRESEQRGGRHHGRGLGMCRGRAPEFATGSNKTQIVDHEAFHASFDFFPLGSHHPVDHRLWVPLVQHLRCHSSSWWSPSSLAGLHHQLHVACQEGIGHGHVSGCWLV